MQGWADDVDFGRKIVTVEESVVDPRQGKAMAEDRYAGEGNMEVGSERIDKRRERKR